MKEINSPSRIKKRTFFKNVNYNIVLCKKQDYRKWNYVFKKTVNILHQSLLFKFLTCLMMLYNDKKTDVNDSTIVKTDVPVYFSSSQIPK